MIDLDEFQQPRSEIACPFVSNFVVRVTAHRLRQTIVYEIALVKSNFAFNQAMLLKDLKLQNFGITGWSGFF